MLRSGLSVELSFFDTLVEQMKNPPWDTLPFCHAKQINTTWELMWVGGAHGPPDIYTKVGGDKKYDFEVNGKVYKIVLSYEELLQNRECGSP